MCYKVSISNQLDLFEERFDARVMEDSAEWKQYFHANGFAHPALPVITQKDPGFIQLFEWGLIPSFAKDTADAKKKRVGNLNARCETIFDLNTWKSSIRKRRCLILADGFYESRDHEGKKYPYYVYRADGKPFAFAGLYNVWKDENGIWRPSMAIVTTDATEHRLMKQIHNKALRMPVILPQELERKWISDDLLDEEIKALMVPIEDGVLAAHTVSTDLNKTKFATKRGHYC